MMRYDFSKVITERPRGHRDRKYKRAVKRSMYRKYGMEEFPNNISMRKMYVYDGKVFSDLLGPLEGYIFKAAREERYWSDVYSEIKKVLNGNGVLQQHVLEHVFNYLYFKNDDGSYYQCGPNRSGAPRFYIENNKVVYSKRGFGFSTQDLILIEDDKLHIFKHKDSYPKPKKEPIKAGNKEIEKVDGIWYWIKEKKEILTLFGKKFSYKLTQISKKDLKKYNL